MKLSKEEIKGAEFLDRGRTNIVFFAEELLGIKLNPGQKRWFRLFQVADDGWSWYYKTMLQIAGNQVGKTLGLAIVILWACNYKIGVSTRDEMAWYNAPYQWFHVAPQLNQAYLPLNDIRLILKSAHPAQEKFGGKCILPQGFANPDSTLEQYYTGINFWNGAVCHFRPTTEKGAGLQGRRAAGITFDEAAFENYLTPVINEVLYMRLISTGGPLILVSTPNGINDFYEVVTQMLDRCEVTEDDDKLWINEITREGIALSTVEDNIGYGITYEEYLRMERGLDPNTKEQNLRGVFLASQDAYFVPQNKIMAAFKKNLPNRQQPIPGHRYAIFVDPSVQSDPTAMVVLDVTKKPWRGVYYEWDKNPRGINSLVPAIMGLHTIYNNAQDRYGRVPSSAATTGYDATGMGGQIVRQHLSSIRPQMPVNFAGTTKIKRNALSDLRAALLMNELHLPDSWIRMKRELQNYKLEDERLEQDSVIALAGAAMVGAGIGGAMGPIPFSVHSQSPTYYSRRR